MEAICQLEPDQTVAAMAHAMIRELSMEPADAHEIAGFVIGAFNGRAELDDEELPSDLRAIFYTLEGKRLLSFRREEYRSEEGHLRRAFFWRIRWENVGDFQQGDGAQVEKAKATVYEDLPQNAWSRA